MHVCLVLDVYIYTYIYIYIYIYREVWREEGHLNRLIFTDSCMYINTDIQPCT